MFYMDIPEYVDIIFRKQVCIVYRADDAVGPHQFDTCNLVTGGARSYFVLNIISFFYFSHPADFLL